MKKDMSKLAVIIFIICIMLNFSGCEGLFSSPSSLMVPPKSSGDLINIESVLAEKQPNYQFTYPSNGEYRNAIIIKDLNNDGINESIVFYKTSDNQTIAIHMNVLTQESDKWVSVYDVTISGTGIDRVEFSDICGDKTEEILVGSKLYNNNEQELNIYKYDNNKISVLGQERYTEYTICSLGASKKSQILLLKIQNETSNISDETTDGILNKSVNAKLISFSHMIDGTLVSLGSLDFDSSIVSFSNIQVSAVSDDRNGVFVDAFVSDNAMITEIFYYEETLKTTFYNKKSGAVLESYRESLIGCRDINFDGRIEIPKTYSCPGYDGVEDANQKVYFTEWYGIDGITLSNKVSSGFLNSSDNYYISMPNSWLGKVTAQRNLDIRERTFYDWDFNKKTFGEMLFKVRVFLKSDFEKNNRGYEQIRTDNEFVYAVKVNENAKSENKVTVKYLRDNMKLI